MEDQLFNYRAEVVSVYDGDTIRVDIDLGLKTWIRNEKIRLARIDAPELRGSEKAEGIAARDFLRAQILDREIILETEKDQEGKYGRYLGEIWIKDETGEYINVNDLMVQKGFARYAQY